MTFEIKTYNNIAQEGLKYFDKGDFAIDSAKLPDAVILRSENLHDIPAPDSLLAIGRAGAGTNNIPVDKASEKGIVVFNTPGANANAVKESVLGALINASRNLVPAANWVQQLQGDDVAAQAEKGKKQFAGTELYGKKLGIIGLGAIGAMVANDAYRLGMEVLGYDPFVSVETAWKISRRVERTTNVDDIFKTCDYITIHVPYTPETKGLVNAEKLALVKPSTKILNFARGELVDNAAIIAALDAGQLESYTTDFATPEVLRHDKITVFPHVGASTEEAEINCAIMASRTVKDFLETGEIRNSVNMPTVAIAFNSPYRITVAHENVPNMLGQISTIVANEGINISDLVNRSRDNFAYTVVDLEQTSAEQLANVKAAIEKVPAVKRVRIIKG
jgi:D-3-phosphoglycerate dehydrogenase